MLRRPAPARRPARRLLLVVGTAVAVAGCSSSSSYDAVDLEGLEDGPCSTISTTLEAVDADLRGLSDGDVSPAQAAERFVPVQDELAEAPVGAEVEPAVTDLITSLGFFRVSADTNTSDSDDASRVRTSLSALADACRTG